MVMQSEAQAKRGEARKKVWEAVRVGDFLKARDIVSRFSATMRPLTNAERQDADAYLESLFKGAERVVSFETYETAIKALTPFAAMYRGETNESPFYIARGTGYDKTVLTEQDLKRAFEIVDAFLAQPQPQDGGAK